MGPRADRPKRLTFTQAYEDAILAEYAAAEWGQRGTILRREGLYSSHLVEWHRSAGGSRGAGGAWRAGPEGSAGRADSGVDGAGEQGRGRAGPDAGGVGPGGKSTRALGDALRERGHAAAVEQVINPLVVDLAAHTSTVEACRLLGRSRAGHYRSLRPPAPAVERRPRPAPCNALTQAERAHVLAVLASERFVDKSVAQVWATLLDEGTYPCSMSTMHRILRANHAAGERRSQATHPPRTVPELLAKPGQVWSWDITKLRGPTRGVYYDLHVVLDIFSRFVVAWTVAAREDATIATEMLAQAMGVHGIPDVVHADRGTSMTSKPDAQLPVDLGVTRSHSRPRVSNDNPYNEAAFKTLEYTPVFPENFGSLADARAFGEKFFGYDNHKHRHSGIGLHTPASVHYGTARDGRALRQATLDAAYQARPERFGHHRPEPPILPTEAWINQPSREALIQSA